MIEDKDSRIYKKLYNQLIDIMEKILEILKDQQSKGNFKWIKDVEKNFKLIKKMLTEIMIYKRRKTMP